MAFIDEKGRMFGLVNPVDLAVGLFLLGALALIFGGFFLPDAADQLLQQHAEWKTYRVQAGTHNMMYRHLVTEGDRQINLDGETVAEVVGHRITTFKDVMDGQVEDPFNQEPILVLDLRIRAKLWPNDIPAIGDYYLLPGELLRINTNEYTFWGTVYTVEPDEGE